MYRRGSNYSHSDVLDVDNLVDLLGLRAAERPERLAYTFLSDGETAEVSLTWSELDERARAIGAALQALGTSGERVLLLHPPGLDYISAFFGCLYAGAVAVPAYPPRANQGLTRVQSILTDARPKVALTNSVALSRLGPAFEALPALNELQWLATDDIRSDEADQWRAQAVNPETIAFLQYTSGSTAFPKGVMVSHGNLLHNERLIREAFRQTEESIVVGWLPLYHDMGLIGNVLQPLYTGARCVLMSPFSFLQKPVRWLQAISRYGGTTSGGPNFAYDLCVRKITEEQRSRLDLSTWATAFNGAEPIRAATLDNFARAFEPCGFRREAFSPCYGLAEATLIVCGGAGAERSIIRTIKTRSLKEENRIVAADVADPDTSSLVSCGRALLDQRILVVDPETATVRAPGEVGEIWVSGKSVACGYWERPQETEQTFGARLTTGEGPFLRTGDVGAIHDGELFILGRLKDTIIIRGANHYPQDLELTVEQSHPSMRPGCGAAFSVDPGGEEGLVIIYEVSARQENDLNKVIARIRGAVVAGHEIEPHAIALIRAGSIPKTSSGKIRRRACKDLYLGRKLDALAEWSAGPDSMFEIPAPQGPEQIESWLVDILARRLGVAADEIDRDRPVAAYGLDSLTATEACHAIETSLGVVIDMVDLLRGVSISQLASNILDRSQSGYSVPVDPLNSPSAPAKEYALSVGQKALWFLNRLIPGNAAYNIASAARVRSDLNVTAFRRALQLLLERHALLRSTIKTADGDPVQRIGDGADVWLLEEDASGWTEEEIGEQMFRRAQTPFDLENGPLLRVYLLRRGDDEHVILLSVHHIVADMWSLALIIRELGILYEAEISNKPASLDRLPLDYFDYVRWQEELLSGAAGERLWRYWQARLSGSLEPLNLPADRTRLAVETFRGHSYAFTVSPEVTNSLRRLAQSSRMTLYTVLLAAFQILLYRMTGQEEILVGSPTAGRSRAHFASVVGYFVNMVVMKTKVCKDLTFKTFVEQAASDSQSALEHGDYPFALLVERLQPERSLRRSPLVQAVFALQKTYSDQNNFAAFALGHPELRIKLGPLDLESIPLKREVSQFDLSLMMAESGEGLLASFEYAADLFDRDTIRRFAGHFQTLLAAICQKPDCCVADLPILNAAEREQLLIEWNDTGTEFAGQFVHHIFEATAEQSPNAIAVQFEARHLTFEELNNRANQLAHYLSGLGIGPETVVGICMERSLDFVIAIMGAIKAGAAYLPIDPAYPAERFEFLMEDSRAPLLLTQQCLLERTVDISARVVALDSDWAKITKMSAANLAAQLSPENPVYVIYTSGSTGRPKGTIIPHRGLANYLQWCIPFYDVAEGGAPVHSSIGFDLTITSLFSPLLAGRPIALVSERDGVEGLVSVLGQGSFSLLKLTPSHLELLSRQSPPVPEPGRVKTLVVGGEALPANTVSFWTAHDRAIRIINEYGPTETVVGCCVNEIAHGEEVRVSIPIGRPISNTQLYLLDSRLQPVPTGVVAEMFVGGAGLARGYLNRADLTAEKFIPNPFSDTPGARMYRTGDVCRYLADGRIDFLGRIDDQIKVRGFRIEPGEIEELLVRHPAIQEAAVAATGSSSSDARLVAYLVPAPSQRTKVEELRTYLKQKLPEYMVPSAFMMIDSMPLNENGKIDRKALPAFDQMAFAADDPHVPPRTEVEKRVAEIFSELLRVDRVGINCDFFQLGGHSLLSARAISRIREAFNVELPLRAVFEAPTVAGLAALIEQRCKELVETEGALTGAASAQSHLPEIPRSRKRDRAPASFGQQRLWLLDQLGDGSAFYNVGGLARFEGEMNASRLRQALLEIVRRHEILRTRFEEVDGELQQVVTDAPILAFDLIDLTALHADRRCEDANRLASDAARRRFDLVKGPLIRFQTLKLESDLHLLVLCTHHIISDGWSMGNLLREIASLYDAYADGEPSPLPELETQYSDYAAWQRLLMNGELFNRQLAYWKKRLESAPALLELPTDRPRPPKTDYAGAREELVLDSELVASLKQLCGHQGATLYMALMAGLVVLLHRYSFERDILIGSPLAGRSKVEFEDLIGFFVNTVVIRTEVDPDKSFRGLLDQVKRGLLEAYENHDVPFEKLVEELAPERGLGHSPIFQVMFVFQNAAELKLEMKNVTVSLSDLDTQTAKFDLSFSLYETEGRIKGEIEFSAALFDRCAIKRLRSDYARILSDAAANADRRVKEIVALTEAERTQIEAFWNSRPFEQIAERTIQELIEHQAERTPDRIALVDEREWLSYRSMNNRANLVGHYLQTQGAGPEEKIGICMERKALMVIAMLGILKAGAAYVPLDPRYPTERLNYMLADAGVRIVLTESGLRDEVWGEGVTAIAINQDQNYISAVADQKPVTMAARENLAYVIYTSGSTGKPKGVAIQHGSVTRFIRWAAEYFGPDKLNSVFASTSINFDLSVFELIVPLSCGGRVVIGQDALDLNEMSMVDPPSMVNMVPSAMRELIRVGHLPPSVRVVNLAGEALSRKLVEELYESTAVEEVVNLYGPTEDTTYSTSERLVRADAAEVSIGRPIEATSVYILNGQLEPVGIGMKGELCIGGEGLARGYIGKPDFTADRFIPDPYDAKPGARMYRTGDITRFLNDGRIQYLGRADQQVKLRGYRIELGEIESEMAKQSAVTEAAVVVKERKGEKTLAAYYVSEDGASVTSEEIKSRLRNTLPHYLIPAFCLELDAMPLTANGKIDRRKLSEREDEPEARPYVAPRDVLEETVARVWCEVLDRKRVSLEESFFELGGHSLSGARVVGRLRDTFNIDLPLRNLFSTPTVAGLSEAIRVAMRTNNHSKPSAITRVSREKYQMSADQRKMLVAQQSRQNKEK